MAHEPSRGTSALLESAGGAQGGEEATLERYLERPSPIRDWLEAKIRRAPWWCISFLVHILAVLILWSWPAPSSAKHEEFPPELAVEIYKEEETERPDERFDLKPEDPPDVPDDARIEDARETTVAGGPVDTDVRLPEPEFPQDGIDDTAPDVVIDDRPHLIAIEFDGRPPRPSGVQGDRSKLRKWIEDGTGPGQGPGTGADDRTIVTPLLAALLWLQRAQEPDGSWDARKWEGSSSYSAGMTGLALLAFEGAGFTHTRGRFRLTVARGLDWLRRNQRENGSFPWETFYEQGIATMAACEAYGLTEDPRLRAMAQRAVDYIVKMQPEHGGFRYGGAVPQAEGDTSVTAWQIQAIKSALLANLRVPPQAVERSKVFLKNTWRDYGQSSYLAGNQAPGTLAITSIGLLCRIFLNDARDYDGEIGQTIDYLMRRENPELTPVPGGATKQLVTDIYYAYYSSLAMFQFAGEASEQWRAWRTMYRAPLIAAQVHQQADARGKYLKGSWDPGRVRWGDRGGRVYATAMAALCLEAPFRYLPTSQAKR